MLGTMVKDPQINSILVTHVPLFLHHVEVGHTLSVSSDSNAIPKQRNLKNLLRAYLK